MRFWKMAGPAGFLDEVLGSLGDRRNVVIAAPGPETAGLDRALTERLRAHVVDCVQVADSAGAAEQVAAALGVSLPGGGIDVLFSSPQFLGSSVIHVQGLTSRSWPEWRQFIVDFDGWCKDSAEDGRPTLIAVLSGMDLPPEIGRSVTFRGFRWHGQITEMDVAQYVLPRLEHIGPGDGARLLAASIIAKLAIGDVGLAEELAGCPVADIWQPEAVLRAWAERNSWEKEAPRHWTSGTVFRTHGRDEVHSALIVLEDPDRVIQSRVWSAQAAMLLPAIERERVKLLSRARSHLKGPFHFGDDQTVADARDLDIGPLEYQLRRRRAPADVCRRATELKEIRNKLAHMERLTIEESLYSGLL